MEPRKIFYLTERGSNDRNGNSRQWVTLFDPETGERIGDRTRVENYNPHATACMVAVGLGLADAWLIPLGGLGFGRAVEVKIR